MQFKADLKKKMSSSSDLGGSKSAGDGRGINKCVITIDLYSTVYHGQDHNFCA